MIDKDLLFNRADFAVRCAFKLCQIQILGSDSDGYLYVYVCVVIVSMLGVVV